MRRSSNVETARALADANAEVTLAVRAVEAGEKVAADITATTGNDKVLVAHLDLADQRRRPRSRPAESGPPVAGLRCHARRRHRVLVKRRPWLRHADSACAVRGRAREHERSAARRSGLGEEEPGDARP